MNVLKQTRGQARQLIAGQGIENAMLWLAYVLDPGNRVENPLNFLYKAAIVNNSPPPIQYTQSDVDFLIKEYMQKRRQADAEKAAWELSQSPIDVELIADVPAVQNNGLSRLWATALAELQPQLPGAFDGTLAGSALLSITDGLALVQVVAGAQEVCDRRLRLVVLRTLAAVATEPVQDVKFQEVA